MRRRTPCLSLLVLLASACGGDEVVEQVCISGVTQTCSCPGDRVGTQVCKDDGTGFGRCLCPGVDASQPQDSGLRPDASRPDGARPDSSTADASASDSARSDGARPDSAAPDGARADAGLPDTARADSAAIDVAATDAARADAATSDAAQSDAARPDTALPDTLLADSAPGVDTAPGIDAAGRAGVGEACNAVPCQPDLICTSSTSGYYCRVRCTLGGSDCDPTVEACIDIITVDGGACVPGLAPSASCIDEPCADIYLCLAPSSSNDFRCRYPCNPVAVDAGCPGGICYDIIGRDGGGCI